MKVQVNGNNVEVHGQSLQQVLAELGYDGQSFAVAVNAEFVARTDYADTMLNADDALEILVPRQGG